MSEQHQTTIAALPEKDKRLIISLLNRECGSLEARLEEEYNVDVRCQLRTKLSQAERLFEAVKAWPVKEKP